jgi:hypothetical protein
VLTLLSVKYGDPTHLRRNAALCRRLNPSTPYTWIAVNNDFDAAFAAAPTQDFVVVPGAPRVSRGGDRGSAHHAAGIMLGLRAVQTRYVLVLDHDFYAVRPAWMDQVLRYAGSKGLAFWGSVWHPRWSYQPRDFPSPHCLLIDLEQVRLEDLDFAPDMGSDRLDAFVSNPRTPIPQPLRTLLQVARFRDTGWRVRERFRTSGLRFERLQVHWNRDAALEAAPALHRALADVLPTAFNPYPKGSDELTEASFLRAASSFGSAWGWEEFFWQGTPFALHLRGVGRGVAHAGEAAELERVLTALTG